ncbi:MAG: DUF4388 domain-containing protein [candidate division Zixibacteria bacterium]
MDLDLQGNIERFTLPEIFQLVLTSRKTGTLGIQRDDDIVMVYFKNGSVIYGYGPRKTYHVGRMLVENGRLTSGQLDEAISIQANEKSSGRRLGQILIEKSYIDRADLEHVVRNQVEELIYSLMAWDQGSFKFYENQFPTEEEITVNLSTENIVLEGMRRLDEITRVKEFLPDFSVVFALSPSEHDQKREVTLEPNEWNILALIDGHRNINDIIAVSSLDSYHVLKTVATLKLAGLICPVQNPSKRSDRLEGMVDRLSQLIEDYLTDKMERTFDSRLGTGEKS